MRCCNVGKTLRLLLTRSLSFQNNSTTIRSPEILTSEGKVDEFTLALNNFGFNKGQIDFLFKSSQCILSLSKKDLNSNLSTWLYFNPGPKHFTAFTVHAELLTLTPAYINSRVKDLMTLFTRKDINKLLHTCPKVFLDEFSEIHEKVQYIVYMMGVEQKSIVKSCALQFDVNHVKCRHNFMSLAGKYKVYKKSVLNKNPPLNKVFSRNIDTFLKLTNLTEEEYDVFSDIYSRDLLNIDDENGESDSEDECN